MSWIEPLSKLEEKHAELVREEMRGQVKASYRIPQFIRQQIVADLKKGEAIKKTIRNALEQYTHAAIAERHGIHERTVGKIKVKGK